MFHSVHVDSVIEGLRGVLSGFVLGSAVFFGIVLIYNIYLAFKNGTDK